MSFEYGSESLEIKNPFKIEGGLFLIRGLVIAVLGGILLFSIKSLVASGAKPQAWAHMLIGMFLVLSGLIAAGRGLFKMFRFFVGRSVPASLCKNYAQSENHTKEACIAYDSKHIEQMLMGRKNLTFIEPMGWINRLIYTIFPKLLYMPYPVRNVTQRIISGLLFTFLSFAIYGLALFSSATGLVTFTNTPVANWFGIGLTAAVLIIWLNKCSPLKSQVMDVVEPANALGLTLMITSAILVPFALDWLHGIRPLPEIPISSGKWMIFTGILVLIVSGIGIALAVLRIKAAHPMTNVSEYKDHWQENLHPMDIFRAFNMIMADYRYKEIPNRMYREFDPKLMIQGSDDKGDFKGDIIQETQPVFIEKKTSKIFDILRLSSTVIAQIMFVLSAIWLFKAAGNLNNVKPDHLVNTLLPPLLFWIFAVMMQKTVHVYWAEMHFKSHLIHFFSEGTYTESKLSTGMSIYDSTRSENPVVRSSLSPWLLASEIITCTFADSGANNLENLRHVLEMHKNEEILQDAIRKLRKFMDERQIIAGVKSQKDFDAAGNMYRMNVATRPQIQGQQQAYPPQIPNQGENSRLGYDGNNQQQGNPGNGNQDDSDDTRNNQLN